MQSLLYVIQMSTWCQKNCREKADYIHIFICLSKLVRNEMNLEDPLFVEAFMGRYIGEEEYMIWSEVDIMCVEERQIKCLSRKVTNV